MGKIKQEVIAAQELEEIRRYNVNDVAVSREVFIMQLAFHLFECPEIPDIRSVINTVLNGRGPTELLYLGNMKFFSYLLTQTEIDMDNDKYYHETKDATVIHPIKKYIVSYDIDVVSLLISARHGHKWKRTSVTVEGMSFRDAREKFKSAFEAAHPDRKVKSILVRELAEIQKEDEDTADVSQKS